MIPNCIICPQILEVFSKFLDSLSTGDAEPQSSDSLRCSGFLLEEVLSTTFREYSVEENKEIDLSHVTKKNAFISTPLRN